MRTAPLSATQARLEEIRVEARRARLRSERLIGDSRSLLGAHSEAVAALRVALVPGSEARVIAVTPPACGVDQLVEDVNLGPLTLLPLQRAIRGPGSTVRLTPAEWQLLVALAVHRPSVLSRPRLAVAAWGPGFGGRHGEVEVYVSRLRRKLARCAAGVGIRTVRGDGYCLSVEQAPVAGRVREDGVA